VPVVVDVLPVFELAYKKGDAINAVVTNVLAYVNVENVGSPVAVIVTAALLPSVIYAADEVTLSNSAVLAILVGEAYGGAKLAV